MFHCELMSAGVSQTEHLGGCGDSAGACGLSSLVARRRIALTALSEATGIPRSTLHNKLRGKSRLTIVEVVRIAIALDVPAADLIAVTTEAACAEHGRQAPG